MAASACPSLRRLPIKEVAPALVITICPPGKRLPAFEVIVKEWAASADAPTDTANAAALALSKKVP